MSQRVIEVLIFSIPEGIVIFNLASSLLARKITIIRLTTMGMIFGTMIYLIRIGTGNFIIGILFSCFLAFLLLKFIGKYNIFDAGISGIMAMSLYLAIEFLNVKLLQVVTGLNPIILGTDLKIRILWFIPQIIAALGISKIIRFFAHRQDRIWLKEKGL